MTRWRYTRKPLHGWTQTDFPVYGEAVAEPPDRTNSPVRRDLRADGRMMAFRAQPGSCSRDRQLAELVDEVRPSTLRSAVQAEADTGGA